MGVLNRLFYCASVSVHAQNSSNVILNHPIGNSLQLSGPDCFVFEGEILANESERDRSSSKVFE